MGYFVLRSTLMTLIIELPRTVQYTKYVLYSMYLVMLLYRLKKRHTVTSQVKQFGGAYEVLSYKCFLAQYLHCLNLHQVDLTYDFHDTVTYAPAVREKQSTYLQCGKRRLAV